MTSLRSDATLCNGGALRKAARRVSQLYDAVLAPCGLKLSQHAILAHVDRAGAPPSMGQLAKALVLDRSALAHNIKPLERDGLIEQLRDPEDGRSRLVALTDAGRSKLVESKRLWRLAQARFEHVYGEDDAKALRSALARIHSDEFAEDFVAVGD
ncbi:MULTISPECIES: MarR family winged helix-turn-helix transcriptional regulator [Cupriavidus]|uniref:MarR family winged helix-turn-helix transcriptional regulator n=1 Tax=Cupriavidus TaxID=106589 RepID=UPI000376DEAE|nr:MULTISPECIES: MarR family winged helix-turn-helix transcriptional regulator [Cupriavidus]